MSAGRAARVMRAVRVRSFGPPEVMKVESDVPIPQPAAKQILIKVAAAGVNPVETYIRSGNRDVLPPLPYTPGGDAAGTVEEVGPGVEKYKPGDRVYTCTIGSAGSDVGSYSEYTIADERRVFHLPSNINFKQGASLGGPYFTAYRSLFQRARARPGQTVLIHGASGAVGIATLQFCRNYGMKVLGTAGSAAGMELIKKEGAHHTFNHRESDYIDSIKEVTKGHGVDVIIEMLSNVNLQKDLELLAVGGTVAIVGCRGNIEISPRLTMGKETSIVGVMLGRSSEADIQEQVAAVHSGMEAGWIKPVVYREYPLEQAPEAHHEIIDTKSAQGRIVLIPCQ